jgi:hypothetical protein
MNRLKQAWLALCGKLEPVRVEVPVPVIGPAHLAPIYCATTHNGLGGKGYTFYLTCEQAHLGHPGCEVSKTEAIKIGDRYFGGRRGLGEIKVQPKPKVAKGKKSG